MKRFGLIFFAFTIFAFASGSKQEYYASIFSPEWRGTISSVSRLELADGVINGEKAEYTFTIPDEWKNRIIVDREKLAFSADALERLYFYFQPINIITQPVFFMSITVHDKSIRYDSSITKLLETRKYIFEIQMGESSEISDPMDQETYNLLINMASDHEMMKSLILLSQDDEKILEDTILVNGCLLGSRVIKDGDTLYLPLREACEALGYTIGWLDRDKAATVKRDATASNSEFYFLIFTDYMPGYPGFSTMMADGKLYVSSMFFIQRLHTNMEIDEYDNVYITE